MNTQLQKTLILQKLCAFFITLGAFIYLNTAYNFMLLAIVLGHSHFLLAYFYKVAARKIKLKNFLIYAVLSTGIFLYFYRIDFPDFRLETLLFVATIYFIYHGVVDDQFTLNFFSPIYSKVQRLQIFSLISALTGLQLKWQFNWQYAWVFILVSFLFYLLMARAKERESLAWNNADLYFSFEYVLTAVLFFSNATFTSGSFLIIAFYGISHYLAYYFHYYLKIKSIEPKTTNILYKRRGYLTVIIISNLLIPALFFYNKSAPNQYLTHFFSYNLFLILTLMHFISSTRTYELSAIFGLKKN